MRKENRFLEVTYQNGDKEVLFFKDFASGAMIENVVRRLEEAVHQATDRGVGQRGIFHGPTFSTRIRPGGTASTKTCPIRRNPDDWAKILGQEGRTHRLRAHVCSPRTTAVAAAGRSSASNHRFSTLLTCGDRRANVT